MDTGYPALIADPPNIPNPPKAPGASDSEENQATLPSSEPTGTPPTIANAS